MNALRHAFVVVACMTAATSHAAAPAGLTERYSNLDTQLVLPDNVITLEPGAILTNRLEIAYERVLNPFLSLSVSPGFKWTGVDALDFMKDVGWVKLGAGLRWYPKGEAPTGFFMGANGSVANAWRTRDDDTRAPEGVALAANMLFGYSWLFHGTLNMSLAGGVQYVSAAVGNDYRAQRMILPTAEFKIGPAF